MISEGKVQGFHVPPMLVFLATYCATFTGPARWLTQFSTLVTILIGMLWLNNEATAADAFLSLGWAGILAVVWIITGISLFITHKRRSPATQLKLMDKMGLGSLTINDDLLVLWSNDTWQALTKSSNKKSQKFLQNIQPEDRDELEHQLSALALGAALDFETRLCVEPKSIPVKLSFIRSQVSDQPGYEVLCQNLSILKNTQAALKASEKLLYQQLDNTPLIHMHWTVDGRIKGWNKAAEVVLGYSKQQAMGMHLVDFVAPKLKQDASDKLKSTLDFSGPTTGIAKVYHRDGSSRHIRYHNNVVSDQSGTFTGIHGFAEDITEELRLRNVIRDKEAKFSSVFQSCPDGLVLVQIGDRAILDANSAFMQILGFTEEDLEKPEFQESWKPLHKYNQFMQYVNRREVFNELETDLLKKNGDSVTTLLSTGFLKVNDSDCLLIVVKDMTLSKTAEKERRSLEAQLSQAQKMESIGQLAGGIAHDFNNMIGAMQGFGELIRDTSDNHDSRHGYATKIISGARRASDLTSKLLAFSRNDELVNEPFNMVDCVDNTLSILEQTIDPRITLSFIHPKNKYIVNGDASQIESSLLNLCLNARDAMPEGGDLSIKIEQLTLDSFTCKQIDPDLQPGDFIQISVSDSGEGIALDIHQKIMLPFFTTKEIGKGSGLGLSSVYGTVKSHFGALTVHSEPGNGACFKIFIPSSNLVLKEVSPKKQELIRGSGTILLIEDEPDMREMTKESLELAGYKVITAIDGAEGVRVFAINQAEIALVVLDLIMPVMNGSDTLQAIRAINPKAKVLIASGYNQTTPEELATLGSMGFLSKPYSRTELCRKVDAAIKTIKLSHHVTI